VVLGTGSRVVTGNSCSGVLAGELGGAAGLAEGLGGWHEGRAKPLATVETPLAGLV
jgi:hypothetical protein